MSPGASAAARRVLRPRPGLAVPALLVLLSVLQSPGRVTFDTDLDLALNPGHLLGRAMHLWGAGSGFGGVGDQTYGFLFPMGPFFAVGDLLAVPDWLVQRLWCGLVLVLAYEGARRLVLRMVSPRPLVAVVAGLAWALSPRMVTVVGPFSAEALPVALLPWMLLPLVVHHRTDPRKAAWLSGLAVLGVGAVNASATLAVLPVPLLYLLTRPVPWRQRLRGLRWWAVAVLLATAWWVGPLVLLGSYSPPFTDWVESAVTTTSQLGAFAALRGVTDWVAFVPETGHGYWPGAFDLATAPLLVVLTALAAALSLAGLTSRRLPERTFLLVTALLGFVVLTAGHAGALGSPVSGDVRSLLDHALVPFRNVYKFDGVLRLPLLLGLAHAVDRGAGVRRRLAPALAAVLVLSCALPALTGQLRPGPGFAAVPTWWTSAARYVAADGVDGRTLVLPEASAGRYTWGRTIGEPLEALARSPWAVRNQVPLTQPGNTRLVDAIEGVLASGRGSPSLADALARSGVGQVLIRNDLDRSVADTLPPVRVRQALQRSAGMRLRRTFGPPQPDAGPSVDGGTGIHPRALEVWVVDRPVAGPSLAPLDEVTALGGGPEDLLTLLESGVVAPDLPTVLTPQAGAAPWTGPRVLTDGLQRRERSFGKVHDALGPLMTSGEPFRQERAAHDLLPFAPDHLQTTASYDGLVSVTASSSSAYADSFGGTDISTQPAAALDDDVTTAWRSGGLTAPVGQWLQVVRTRETVAPSVTVRMVASPLYGPLVTRLRVTTDAGQVVVPVAAVETPQVLALPEGPWRRLRLTVDAVRGSAGLGFVGIRELTVPGLVPRRTGVAPSVLPEGVRPPAVAFRAVEPVAACLLVDGTQRCDPGSVRPGEERGGLDRTFTLPSPSDYAVTGTVLPTTAAAVGALLTPAGPALVAQASSSLDAGAVGPAAAVDGDPSTSWVAGPLDGAPALTVSWQAPADISRVVLVTAQQPRTSVPQRVRLASGGQEREAELGPDGTLRFAPLRTSSLTLTFPAVRVVTSTSSRNGVAGTLPLGIAEVQVPEAGVVGRSTPDATPTGAICGLGPTLEVDGHPQPTRVVGTIADVRESQPLAVVPCGTAPLSLSSGTHRIRLTSTELFQVRSVVLRPAQVASPQDVRRAVRVVRWDEVHRVLDVDAGAASLLVVPEAANKGWVATLQGAELAPMPADGWQQGWVVPAGQGGRVSLTYRPDAAYRLALGLGAGAALLLLALALLALRPRRTVVAADEGPVPDEGPAPSQVPVAVGVGALLLLAGGPVCLGGFALAAVVSRRGRRLWAVLACVAAPVAAAAWAVLAREGTFASQTSRPVQALCLLAVGALGAQLLRQPATGPDVDDALRRLLDAGRVRAADALVSLQITARRGITPEGHAPPRLVVRLRQAAVCLLLVVVAFQQSPGLIGNDTKLDLTADPHRFLARALELWNPSSAFGQLQNQAYGYLFPMGPFHLLGLELGVPAWAVQRAWMALLLVTAYLGLLRLAARLELGTPTTRLLGALAYALAPRVLTEIGANSSEILPMALLPWTLVPLVGRRAEGLARTAAARSGFAVLCMGAVNATAVLTVLVLPAVWLVPGLRRASGRRLAAWWVLSVVLATAWWVVPLLLQGRYAPDFLAYIETAATTTSTTSLSEVARGSSHWLAYVSTGGAPWWRAGWTLVTNAGVILDTAVLAALCLAGLIRRRMPAQGRLTAAAAVGLLLLCAAHAGPYDGPATGALRDLLDGALAPFRNVHKADPLLRLPLALGLCHLLGSVTADRTRRALAAATGIALLGVGVPALAGQLVPAGGYAQLPSWWRSTGTWLDDHQGQGRVLVVPARGFGEYTWGRPLDDPLQALTRAPWAVRDAVPLGSAGTTRLLDAIGVRLDTGVGSPALAEVLARSGVRYVVVANDLDRARTGVPRPVVVHQALAASPGISEVASFGPALGSTPTSRAVLPDRGLDPTYPAVQVYEVAGATGPVDTLPRAGAWVLSGGPESLFQLADRGLLAGTATTLAGDAAPGPRPRTVLTDGLRRREVAFGSVRDNASATLTADARLTRRQAAADVLPVPGSEHLATVRLVGAQRLTASSSASDAGAVLDHGPEHRPFSAVDGDPTTAWVSGSLTGARGQWLQVDLGEPLDPTGTSLALLHDARVHADVTRVRVTTDTGSATTALAGETDDAQLLAVPAGLTRKLRITVERVRGDGFGNLVGLRSLLVPGLQVRESVVLPADQRGAAVSAVLLDRAPGSQSGCTTVAGRAVCSPDLVRPGEDVVSLDRTFDLGVGTELTVTGQARPLPGPQLDALLDADATLRVRASSRLVADPAVRPGAAADGDLTTGWVAAESDLHPRLSLSWTGTRLVDQVRLQTDDALAAARPTLVEVVTTAGRTGLVVPADGVLRFPPVTTDRLELRVLAAESRTWTDDLGRRRALPVGVSEVAVPGDGTRAADPVVGLPCGAGPEVIVDGTPHATTVSGTRADLLGDGRLPLQLCGSDSGTAPPGSLTLAAGTHRVVAADRDGLRVESLTLAAPGPATPSSAREVTVRHWGPEARAVDVAPGDEAYLVVHENANAGWHATLDGRRLTAARLDGWQQAWVLPAGDGGRVSLDYGPNRTYHRALLAGGLLVLLLAGLALWPVRRLGYVPVIRTVRAPALLRYAGSAAVAVLLGGALGAAAYLVALALVVLLRHRANGVLTWCAGGALTAAGALTALAPWNGSSTPAAFGAPVQVLALVGLGAAAALLSGPRSSSAGAAREQAPRRPAG